MNDEQRLLSLVEACVLAARPHITPSMEEVYRDEIQVDVYLAELASKYPHGMTDADYAAETRMNVMRGMSTMDLLMMDTNDEVSC